MTAPTNDLDRLVNEVLGCRICLDKPTGKPLPHQPRPVLQVSPSARILIAGQAPGTRVHASGKPFTDPSGERLRQWLGVTSDIFYDPQRMAILPMGFCFPGLSATGADLPPRAECAKAWRARLLDLMPQVELIVALGAYALKWHLGSQYKGNLHQAVLAWRDGLTMTPVIMALPHPSWRNNGWLKRNPWFETELLPVLKKAVAARL
jgi:uracil-DNA glycosylase